MAEAAAGAAIATGVVSAGALVVIAGCGIFIGYQLYKLRQAGG